jgi:hypothetical protein
LIQSVPDIETQFQRLSTQEVQALLDEFLSSDATSESRSVETKKYNTDNKVDEAFSKFMNS